MSATPKPTTRVSVGDTLWTAERVRNYGRGPNEPEVIARVEPWGVVVKITPKRFQIDRGSKGWRPIEPALRYADYEGTPPLSAVGNTAAVNNRGRSLYPSRDAAIAAIRDAIEYERKQRIRERDDFDAKIERMREEMLTRVREGQDRETEILAQLDAMEEDA